MSKIIKNIAIAVITILIILSCIAAGSQLRKLKDEKATENVTIYDDTYMAENFEVLSQDIEEINAKIDSMSIALNELQEKLDALESSIKSSEITVDDLMRASNLGIIMPCNKCGNPNVELRDYTTTEGQTRFYIHCSVCYPDEAYDFSDEFGYGSPYECIHSWNYIYGLPSY